MQVKGAGERGKKEEQVERKGTNWIRNGSEQHVPKLTSWKAEKFYQIR